MKRFGLIYCFVLTILSCGLAFATDSALYHYTGRVRAFDEGKIIIDEKEFYVSKECIYQRSYRKEGAFSVEKGRHSDVNVGRSVVVRVNGTIVDQIMVEEWKR